MSGKQKELLKEIQAQMQKYSDEQQFEKAAKMRDSYLDLQKTLSVKKLYTKTLNLTKILSQFCTRTKFSQS